MATVSDIYLVTGSVTAPPVGQTIGGPNCGCNLTVGQTEQSALGVYEDLSGTATTMLDGFDTQGEVQFNGATVLPATIYEVTVKVDATTSFKAYLM